MIDNTPNFRMISSGVVSWTTSISSSGDIGLSRGAAGKLYVGNSAGGDFTGTLIAGNVGIGETAPGSKLSVSGGGSFGAGYDTTAA
ncbi:MAG: hypothetical protein UV10_C0021G0005 [Candidatus Azambacteria bacterium GW2011_GWA1_42_19]|uniref:Uncharacterized protein n=2 Tax=Candidatus Azamiibacteriota TaxID=1752741 RepID=A0A0G1C7B0_9BACT|nr:MAG: hypothetical protein UV10_C0021G0005 [Candidatus Azambacteria bacterium GW2011_GWA1_42_19]